VGARFTGGLPWIAPMLAAGFAWAAPSKVGQATGMMAIVAMVVAAVRFPRGAAIALVAALPLDLYGMSGLYRLGVTGDLLRPLRFWPEAILLGLGVAAAASFLRSARRIDFLDGAAVAYLVLGTAYLLLPRLFVGQGLGAQISFYGRELGWRSDIMYVGVLILARRLPLGPKRAEASSQLTQVLIGAGAALAALGLIEFADPSAWNHFATSVLRVPEYQQRVLNTFTPGTSNRDILVYSRVGGHRFVRIGALLEYESLGFYLAICLGLCAEVVARGRARRGGTPLMGLLALALFLTQTRSAILAGAIAVALVFVARPGRQPEGQARIGFAISGVLIAADILFITLGVGSRIGGNHVSDTAHASSFSSGLQVFIHHPFGRGLATAAGGGQEVLLKGLSGGYVVTEDQWLQIGTQLGIIGLGLYIAICLLSLRQLHRSDRPALIAPAGLENTMIGVLIGAAFLQPFINPAVSITLFLLIGTCVGPPAVTRP
jgi:hypothetical protein